MELPEITRTRLKYETFEVSDRPYTVQQSSHEAHAATVLHLWFLFKPFFSPHELFHRF